MDSRALFKLVGEEGAILRQVEKAMAWLLSPKSERIGERLLNEAHALHGKPLTILVTELEQTGYYNLSGEHTIRLNPKHLAGILIKGPNGIRRTCSLERTLAHEMVHAGQRGAISAESALAFETIKKRAQAAAAAHVTPDQAMEQTMHLVEAANAPNYESAKRHVEAYVDRVAIPMEEAARAHMHRDPAFSQYITEFEVPAIETENHVARLNGEPLRENYATAHEIEPKAMRQMMIDQLCSDLEVSSKPHEARSVLPQAPSWKERVWRRSRSETLSPGPRR